MPNSQNFYKGIFLHVIPVRIMELHEIAEQNQNWNFYRRIFNLIFLLARHSSVCQTIHQSKATNIFPKYILKFAAND